MAEQLFNTLRQLRRLARNAIFDLRYGRFLGGTRTSSAEAIGGNTAANSDYGALSLIFDGLDVDDKVVADIGAGMGRTANFIIDSFKPKKLILIEYDPEICRKLKRRLSKHTNITVINDDFRNVSLEGVEIIYIFNPFGSLLMKDFVNALPMSCEYVIYYNPAKLRYFPDREFTFECILKNHPDYHDCVLVRRRNRVGSARKLEDLDTAAAAPAVD